VSNQQTQDDDRLKDLINVVSAADTKNAQAFDKAILTLSSGALALSLAFIKDIVSPATAEYNILLYGSWVFLMLALAANVTGFMRAFRNSRQLRRLLFASLRHRTESEDRVQPLMDKHLNEVYLIHFWQGGLFLTGAITFTIYVTLNFHHEATMTKTKHVPEVIERAQPSASFFPRASKKEVVMAFDAAPSATLMPKPVAAQSAAPATTATPATSATAAAPASSSPQQGTAEPQSK
jgi:hypothetical protein